MKSLYSYIFESKTDFSTHFEEIICEAWNSKGLSLGSYEKEVSDNGLDSGSIAQNIYNSLVKYIPKNDTLRKLPFGDPATKEWVELGLYTSKPNITPKTDIISSSGIRISVKKETGARLMSGAVNESIATLRVGIEKAGDKELKEFSEKIFDSILGGTTRGRITGTTKNVKQRLDVLGISYNEMDEPKDESERVVWAIEKSKIFLEELISNIKTKYPKVFDEVIYEAASGEVKFGKNSDSCADHMLTWDMNGHCNVYDIKDYCEQFGSKYKIRSSYKSTSVKVGGKKTNVRDTWMVLSLDYSR